MYIILFKAQKGTALVLQWIRLHVSAAGNVDLILGWGTKIPHATWLCQKV